MDRRDNLARRSHDNPKDALERANESFQQDATNAAATAAASYTLIGAVIFFTVIGYAIDRWRGGFSHTFLIIGVLVGIIVGFGSLAKLVWKQ
jgi:F0F1-type ATP synthase assembly protein I